MDTEFKSRNKCKRRIRGNFMFDFRNRTKRYNVEDAIELLLSCTDRLGFLARRTLDVAQTLLTNARREKIIQQYVVR